MFRYKDPIAEKGFVTLAIGKEYLKMAYILALSIKCSQKQNANVSLICLEGDDTSQYQHVFDRIVFLQKDSYLGKGFKKPMQDVYTLFYNSPYRETIYCEADMIIPTDISHWWSLFQQYEICMCNHVYNYRGEQIKDSYYRQHFAKTGLPTLYNAMMYWRRSVKAGRLFQKSLRNMKTWNDWAKGFFPKGSYIPEEPHNDECFAKTVLDDPPQDGSDIIQVPNFIHCKTQDNFKNDNVSELWTEHFHCHISEDFKVYVNNHQITRPFHYQDKGFVTEHLLNTLENKYGK